MALKKGLAIASLILGLFLWLPIFGIIFSGLALIFGINSLINQHRNPKEYSGKAFSILGIILGIIGLLFPIILPIFLILIGAIGMLRFLDLWGLTDYVIPIYGLSIMFFFLLFAILGFTRLMTFTKSIIALISGFIISIFIVLPHTIAAYPAGFNIVEIFTRILESTHPVIENFIFALIPLTLMLRKKSFYLFQILFLLAVIVIFIPYSKIGALIFGLMLVIFIYPIPIILFQYNYLLKKINPKIFKTVSIIALIILAFRLIYTFLNFKAFIVPIGSDSTVLLIAALTIGLIVWLIFTIQLFRNPDFYQSNS
ncbi:MAG: DUF4190 domain-containing protein [SAR202 cluster bacterium]|jgi:hypothetical protein|nr:DUF4190 domain-containing protein [SAR202 cluster bacterium]|tara:strand:- start:169 stop:1104 length:936 start_codon:yes stop_codon:yes gene_type:complete